MAASSRGMVVGAMESLALRRQAEGVDVRP